MRARGIALRYRGGRSGGLGRGAARAERGFEVVRRAVDGQLRREDGDSRAHQLWEPRNHGTQNDANLGFVLVQLISVASNAETDIPGSYGHVTRGAGPKIPAKAKKAAPVVAPSSPFECGLTS